MVCPKIFVVFLYFFPLSQVVKPSRVQESAVQMECKLRHSYEVQNAEGKDTTTVILG